MLYLLFFLINLSSTFTFTPDSVEVKKADIALNDLILKKDKQAARFYADDFILITSKG